MLGVTDRTRFPVTVDHRELEVDDGLTILQALSQEGVRLPSLCNDVRAKRSNGNCGLCVVEVGADGSVGGEALAEALEDEGDYYYEDVSCPATARVATDVTTICRANDGMDDLRVVVVFEGDDGRFRTADLW